MSFRALRNVTGLSLAGKIRKFVKHYKNTLHTFNAGKVNCSVSKIGAGSKVYYVFVASCYCDDALATANLSNTLNIFLSKRFTTRLEAETALDTEIMAASKIFKEITFFRSRYYPQDDIEGELLCCKDLEWSVWESDNVYRCPQCFAEFSQKPNNALCSKCGEFSFDFM